MPFKWLALIFENLFHFHSTTDHSNDNINLPKELDDDGRRIDQPLEGSDAIDSSTLNAEMIMILSDKIDRLVNLSYLMLVILVIIAVVVFATAWNKSKNIKTSHQKPLLKFE